jgi:hypothetical protein
MPMFPYCGIRTVEELFDGALFPCCGRRCDKGRNVMGIGLGDSGLGKWSMCVATGRPRMSATASAGTANVRLG